MAESPPPSYDGHYLNSPQVPCSTYSLWAGSPRTTRHLSAVDGKHNESRTRQFSTNDTWRVVSKNTASTSSVGDHIRSPSVPCSTYSIASTKVPTWSREITRSSFIPRSTHNQEKSRHPAWAGKDFRSPDRLTSTHSMGYPDRSVTASPTSNAAGDTRRLSVPRSTYSTWKNSPTSTLYPLKIPQGDSQSFGKHDSYSASGDSPMNSANSWNMRSASRSIANRSMSGYSASTGNRSDSPLPSPHIAHCATNRASRQTTRSDAYSQAYSGVSKERSMSSDPESPASAAEITAPSPPRWQGHKRWRLIVLIAIAVACCGAAAIGGVVAAQRAAAGSYVPLGNSTTPSGTGGSQSSNPTGVVTATVPTPTANSATGAGSIPSVNFVRESSSMNLVQGVPCSPGDPDGADAMTLFYVTTDGMLTGLCKASDKWNAPKALFEQRIEISSHTVLTYTINNDLKVVLFYITSDLQLHEKRLNVKTGVWEDGTLNEQLVIDAPIHPLRPPVTSITAIYYKDFPTGAGIRLYARQMESGSIQSQPLEMIWVEDGDKWTRGNTLAIPNQGDSHISAVVDEKQQTVRVFSGRKDGYLFEIFSRIADRTFQTDTTSMWTPGRLFPGGIANFSSAFTAVARDNKIFLYVAFDDPISQDGPSIIEAQMDAVPYIPLKPIPAVDYTAFNPQQIDKIRDSPPRSISVAAVVAGGKTTVMYPSLITYKDDNELSEISSSNGGYTNLKMAIINPGVAWTSQGSGSNSVYREQITLPSS